MGKEDCQAVHKLESKYKCHVFCIKQHKPLYCVIEVTDETVETPSFTMNSMFCKSQPEAKIHLSWLSLYNKNIKLFSYQGNQFCFYKEGKELWYSTWNRPTPCGSLPTPYILLCYNKHIYLLVLSPPVASLYMHNYIQHKFLTCNDWVILNC